MITLFISIHLPTYVFADDPYVSCSTPYQCGNINTSYPFWGQGRPENCGQPGFQLNCQGNVTEITIAGSTYRILSIDNTSRSLTVVRADYWNTICPRYFVNTTLDFSLFSYTSYTQNLTLAYDCNSTRIPGLSSQFTCNISNSQITGYYLTISATEILATYGSNFFGICNSYVIVTAFQPEVQAIGSALTQENLNQVISRGFGLQWWANDNLCDQCASSGGQCGYNLNSQEFVCYCSNGTFVRTCGGTRAQSGTGNKSNGNALAIGVSIGGAGIIIVFLGFMIFYVRQRRKRLVDQSTSKDLLTTTTSKDLLTAPSSKDTLTPITNFSQSFPSYPSSTFDVEKGSTYFGAQVFSYAELGEATDNFSRELGEGGFGTVYYGKLRDGRVVAVKRLYENNFKRVEQFMNEVEILTRLRHDNLVLLYGCTSKQSRELLLVYEYIPNGTVADHLHGSRANSGLVTWPVRLSIAIETADALAYLHKSDVIHRDVKSNNILLDNNFCVKVADFGLSRLFPPDVTHVSTAPQGTPGYVDPEYYQCYHLTDKSDVYSFGVVLIELISSKQAVDTGRHRHDINLANMAVNKIQNHLLHELVDPCLGFDTDYAVRRMITSVAGLAFRCLQQERDIRPSMEEVLEVLRGIKNEELNAQKAEVVDIRADDVGLLKSMPPPLSPDSVVTDKWVPNSF